MKAFDLHSAFSIRHFTEKDGGIIVRETVTPLIGADDIAKRVDELAAEINVDYAGKRLYLVGLLKGAVILMADLARKISVPAEFDFMDVSSYDGTASSGVIKIKRDIETSPQGRDILLVEDIIDTGKTLAAVIERIKLQNPASVKVCCLLDKPERRSEKGVAADYVGFTIPNAFVVGYGLDYDQRYRNLPYIGTLKFEETD